MSLLLGMLLSGCLEGGEEKRVFTVAAPPEPPMVQAGSGNVTASDDLPDRHRSVVDDTEAPERPDEDAADAPSTIEPPSPQIVQGWVEFPSGDPYGHCHWLDAIVGKLLSGSDRFSVEFSIDPQTWGGRFTLTPHQIGDLDIVFHGRETVVHSLRDLDGEGGIVPSESTSAHVCLFAGGPTGFTYVAEAGAGGTETMSREDGILR